MSIDPHILTRPNSDRPRSFRVASWLASRANDGLLYRLSRICGWTHYWVAWEKRRNYLANTASLTPARRQKPWHAFQNQALNVFELLKAACSTEPVIRDRVALCGCEVIDRALARGNGLVLATIHTGNWELAGLALALKGYPITTVAGTQLSESWSDVVKTLKTKTGIRMRRHEDGPRALHRDLAANRVVVLHIDGDLFTGGLNVRFLGKSIAVPRGPAHLARVMKAPIALAYCQRSQANELKVIVEDEMQSPRTSEEEHDFTQQLMSRAESIIYKAPGQWCIFRRL